jgi:hypothetical protein
MSPSSSISLRVLQGPLAICRLAPEAAIPDSLETAELLSVTRTPTELSIVCREGPDLPGQVERGWRCLVVDGTLEFDQVGILASLAQPLARAGVSIFVLSTFDTDYLLVKQDSLESALEALRTAGHRLV